MKDQFIKFIEEIPTVLYSDYTDAPMTVCSVCGTSLCDCDVPYLIEKSVFRDPTGERYLTRFELVVCMQCHMIMQNEMSAESLEAINQYMEANNCLEDRRKQLAEHVAPDLDTWLQTCIVTGRKKEALKGYHIYAQCIGKNMIYDDTPFIIGEEALDEMQELLSSKTRDELDHFSETYLGCPPELEGLLRDNPVMIF